MFHSYIQFWFYTIFCPSFNKDQRIWMQPRLKQWSFQCNTCLWKPNYENGALRMTKRKALRCFQIIHFVAATKNLKFASSLLVLHQMPWLLSERAKHAKAHACWGVDDGLGEKQLHLARLRQVGRDVNEQVRWTASKVNGRAQVWLKRYHVATRSSAQLGIADWLTKPACYGLLMCRLTFCR